MPSNGLKSQVELKSTRMDLTDPDLEPWDPYNCPTCRSGVIEYPPAIMADVVNVEL